MQRDAYFGRSNLLGEEDRATLLEASNYATTLVRLDRSEEAKALFRRTIPVARRVLGDIDQLTLRMRTNYAQTLYRDDGATLDDLREAVATLEDTERTARRVLGGAHPLAMAIQASLRTVLRARETPPPARGA